MASESLSLGEARRNLKQLCDAVYEQGEPVHITRKNGRHVVLMSLDEYRRLTADSGSDADPPDSLYDDLEREADA
ncbi:type II toxin-antitoxin system Phd/YefM family antitoxin [Halomonas sp. NO4]|uniref:type II toxin-antitoxin system Phd/YefM family antitoxin n=1 Tax=Halomonas sp. NO4 TaxID=2484813 RepID=UPI0013CF4E7A|nr:type II toxin-antitoxin system Phd/YefM family antitoxin [Halomonas sp. NO4]